MERRANRLELERVEERTAPVIFERLAWKHFPFERPQVAMDLQRGKVEAVDHAAFERAQRVALPEANIVPIPDQVNKRAKSSPHILV